MKVSIAAALAALTTLPSAVYAAGATDAMPPLAMRESDTCHEYVAAVLKQDRTPYRQVATVRGTGPKGSMTFILTEIFTGDFSYSSSGNAWHKSPEETSAYLTQRFVNAWEKTHPTCVAAGREVVDAQPTDVVKLHAIDGGQVVDSTFWISRDSSLPLKAERITITIYAAGPVATTDTVTFEYGNVQPPSAQADAPPPAPAAQDVVKPDAVQIDGWPVSGQTTAEEVRQKLGTPSNENHLDPFHKSEYVWVYVRDSGTHISTFLFDKDDRVLRMFVYKPSA